MFELRLGKPVCERRGGRVVYRGGLENRFRRKPDGGSNPSLSASLRWNEVRARLPRRSAAQAGENEKCFELRLGKPEKIWRKTFVSNTSIIVWAVVIGAAFAYLWWQGQLARLTVYVQETREELKKCSWPTWDELKGSTVLIAISIALLGLFTVVVDQIFQYIFYRLF